MYCDEEMIAFLKCLDSPRLKCWQWLTKCEACASFMMTVQVWVNAELWWTWQMIKCSQWHDLIVLNIQWYGVICFLRYAWRCSHILSNKSSTIQGMLVWWYVCCKVTIHSYILWWQWYDATWYDACFGVMTHFYALWYYMVMMSAHMMMHTLLDTCYDMMRWCSTILYHGACLVLNISRAELLVW